MGAIALALILGAVIWNRSGQVPAVLFTIGVALGVVLFHSRFGFTSAWRQLVSVRQGKALRAHMLMIGVAATLFAPILASGVAWKGVPAAASLAPIGFGLFVGSFLFGLGMQLGGSCASGTLFAVGSGQTSILITLGGFITGSVVGALHFPWWTNDLPSHKPVSLADQPLGYLGAWLITIAVIGVVVGLTYVVRRGRTVPELDRAPGGAAGRGPSPAWLLAAVGRRAAPRRPERPDPLGLRRRLGRHLRVQPLGLEDPRRHRRRRDLVGLLVGPG